MALAWAREALLVAVIAMIAGGGGVLAQEGTGVDTSIAAGPGAYQTNYATPVAAAVPGDDLVFHNLDLFNHNVVAMGHHGPDDQPWCINYDEGECPLFWTPLIGLQQDTAVLGLENAEPGTYTFYCTLHPWMQGTLVVPSTP